VKKIQWTSLFLFAFIWQINSQSSFDLANAIQYGLEHNATTKIDQLDLKKANAEIREYISRGLPKLSGSANLQHFINIPTSLLPGTAYIYTCYGMYDLFNVVTAPAEVAHVVLIRGLQPLEGEEIMRSRRLVQGKYQITDGPGKLSKALGIQKKWSGSNLMESQKIWLEDRNIQLEDKHIISGARVGLTTAEECSNWPWRFQVAGSSWVSKPKNVWYSNK